MINNISSRLTDRLIAKGNITEEDRELYIYGLFMLLSQIMYFFLSVIFGLLFQCFIESVIFYIAFQFIRRYAGGYHAKTETKCEILSTLSLLVCIAIIKVIKTYNFQTLLLFVTIISAVCIFVFCPLDTPEKPLTEKEFKYFRKISWVILLVITVIIVISYFFKIKTIFAPCCLSLILESLLLIAGKLKKCFASNNH